MKASISSPVSQPEAQHPASRGAQAQIDEAQQYLEKHKIPLLIEKIMTALLVEKPASPQEFIFKRLKELKSSPPTRTKPSPLNLFTRENLGALFRIYDVTDKGYITLDQYLDAMKNIGVSSPNPKPQGSARNRITVDAFCEEGLSGLHRAFP